MMPGRSLFSKTSGRSWAPGARMTWAARMCQIRWRDTPGAAGLDRWSVRLWTAMT